MRPLQSSTPRHFVLGCSNLTIAVDHKPLLKIFGDRSLEQITNTRLRNLKEKTLRYRLRMAHIAGVKNRALDVLSRYPSGDASPPKMNLPDDTHAITDSPRSPPTQIPTALMAGISTDNTPPSVQMELALQESLISTLTSTQPISWEQVQTATLSDENMTILLSHIENGFPDQRHQLPPSIREYHPHRHLLYSIDGVAIYKERIIIPASLRQSCLSALHAAHQGTSTMT